MTGNKREEFGADGRKAFPTEPGKIKEPLGEQQQSVRVKYKTTIYDEKYPYGREKTVIVTGEECEKPSYLLGCDEGYMFVKAEKDIIHIIEKDRILELDKFREDANQMKLNFGECVEQTLCARSEQNPESSTRYQDAYNCAKKLDAFMYDVDPYTYKDVIDKLGISDDNSISDLTEMLINSSRKALGIIRWLDNFMRENRNDTIDIVDIKNCIKEIENPTELDRKVLATVDSFWGCSNQYIKGHLAAKLVPYAGCEAWKIAMKYTYDEIISCEIKKAEQLKEQVASFIPQQLEIRKRGR